jgi:copper chaperone CopZ
MCEERIEETVKQVSGVSAADWDKSSGMLMVRYDSVKTNQENIEKACAKVGHGTRTFSVDSTTDATLPSCCRMETEKH